MNKIIMLISFLLVTGCSVTNKSMLGSSVSIETQTKIQGNVDVGEKISGSVKATYLLGLIQLSGPKSYVEQPHGFINPFAFTQKNICRLKDAAYYNAIQNSDAEIIVNPQYTVRTHSAFGFSNHEVEVTGYKGVFTDFENISID